ncbi:hypothetical protein PHDIMM138B_12330 [Phytobacter diazotrophicus]
MDEKSGTRVNIRIIDVNTSGHLNFFAYRLSKIAIAVKIICFSEVTQSDTPCHGTDSTVNYARLWSGRCIDQVLTFY